MLRARPLAAGLDPRFTVLDEAAARRLAERRLRAGARGVGGARGAPAVDLAAAYGPGLRDLLLGAHETLRSRGETHPRLPVPPAGAGPDPPRCAPRARPLPSLAVAGATARRSRRRATRWTRCERLAGRRRCRGPASSTPPSSAAGAKALDDPACEDYREAWEAYRSACADHHARAALVLLDDLLDRFGAAYDAAKAARAGVDFADLELRVRDLLADPAARARWAERFALIMVDEFQDTNRLQLDVLESLERDNLFAVGDEFQSIYRFRHADVTIFRERRARARRRPRPPPERATSAPREELLDVLNGAFAPELGERFAPLVAGAPPVPRDGPRGCSTPTPSAGDARRSSC